MPASHVVVLGVFEQFDCFSNGMVLASGVRGPGKICGSSTKNARSGKACHRLEISGHPESNQGPSDCCSDLQSDALPAEL